MTFVTSRLDDAPLATAAFAPTFDQAPSLATRGPLGRVAAVAGDLFGAVALALCVPFVLLAIGTPIVLFFRLLLWIAGLL